jgi:hypothetical protein
MFECIDPEGTAVDATTCVDLLPFRQTRFLTASTSVFELEFDGDLRGYLNKTSYCYPDVTDVRGDAFVPNIRDYIT